MPTANARVFAYVANAASHELLVFKMDLASGKLTLIEHVLGGKFTTLAATPDRRHLYAGLRDEPAAIASFAIDPERGKLQQIAETRVPGPLAFISVDRTGRWLLAASYHGNFVASCEIAPDGRLREPHQMIASLPKAHAVLAAPANDFVLATSLGADAVLAWPFDAVSGRMREELRVEHRMTSGAGPRHLRFHPHAKRLYVICELDASVRELEYDPATMRMREHAAAAVVPKGFRGKRWAAELQIAPGGKFMYASERTSSTLSALQIGAGTALVVRDNIPTELQPRAFTIDPTGRFLLAVGQKSNRLSVYTIDSNTGALAKIDEYAVGEDPCWVEVIALEP